MVAVGGGFGQPGAGPTHAPPLQYLSFPLSDVGVEDAFDELAPDAPECAAMIHDPDV
jgi:hypothetical protein